MGKLGFGYGSEWHLLRYLGRHRGALDEGVRSVTGVTVVRWLDGSSAPGEADTEWRGISFVPEADRGALADAWARWWPQRGNAHHWDAVARLDEREWLLVEAKARIPEISSSCKAVAGEGRDTIARACAAAKSALGASGGDWLTGYYQTANRLAFLHFLRAHRVPARLLFIYFCGDRQVRGGHSPQTKAEWLPALAAQDSHLGLPASHPLQDRVHRLFLPVPPTRRTIAAAPRWRRVRAPLRRP